jgi:hypothetical protein
VAHQQKSACTGAGQTKLATASTSDATSIVARIPMITFCILPLFAIFVYLPSA